MTARLTDDVSNNTKIIVLYRNLFVFVILYVYVYLELDSKKVGHFLITVLMRVFGYPYNNDLVIHVCKDSPDYLTWSIKKRLL